MATPIRFMNGRPPQGGRRPTQRSDALPIDTDYTLAQVEAHARHQFPGAFAALPPATNMFLNQTIDQTGSARRIKIGIIQLNGIDYALSAYMRKPFNVRFSYDGGKCPLPDHIKNFKLDFPFRCPLLATTRHLTSVYPELESLIGFYMVKEGVVPTFRDHGAHTKASLAALKRACETVWELPRGRAPIVPSPEARAGGVHTPAAPEQPSIPASDPDAGSEDYESDSSDGLFVTDVREMTTEERLKYNLKKANKEIVKRDKEIAKRGEHITWLDGMLDERDAMIVNKNRRIREQRQEIAAKSRWAKSEFNSGQRLALEVNNLERHVGNFKRENEDLWRDNQVLLHRAHKAERELEQAKARLQRRGEPT